MSETEYLVLTEKLAGMTTLINSQFINVNEKLDEQNQHLKKLNGSVAEHEKRLNTSDDLDKLHALTCPQLPRIIELETTKRIGISRRQLIIGVLSTVAMICSIAFTSIKINESMRIKEDAASTVAASDSLKINR